MGAGKREEGEKGIKIGGVSELSLCFFFSSDAC